MAASSGEFWKQWKPTQGRRWTDQDGLGMADALEASGLSIGKFAQHHGLTAQRVYWWLERLGRREKGSKRQPMGAAFVPVRITGSGPDDAVREASAGDSVLELVVGRSTVIRVHRGFDGELLRKVVATLEGAAC